MPAIEENYDVVVVGAGHAGCEAALALSLIHILQKHRSEYILRSPW